MDEEADKGHPNKRVGQDTRAGSSKTSSENATLQEQVVALQKLSLNSAQGMRALMAQVDFCLLPADAAVAAKGLETSKEYATQVKKRGKGHGLGSPHLHVAASVVESLSTYVPKEGQLSEAAKEMQAVLGKFYQEMEKEGKEAMADAFKMCRLKEAYDPTATGAQKVKFTFQLNPLYMLKDATLSMAKVRTAIIVLLREQKGAMGEGEPPRGMAERKVQAQLTGNQSKASKSND